MLGDVESLASGDGIIGIFVVHLLIRLFMTYLYYSILM